MDHKYQGIILGKKDIGETDRIYTVYTLEAGKIKFIGKGTRKPNAKLAGNLEPITFGEIFVSKNRGMGNVTGVIADEYFSGIKSDFFLLEKVFRVFKFLEKIIVEQERDEEFFKLLLSFLKTLENLKEEKGEKAEVVVLGFLVKFLDQMGYRIEAEKCVNCSKKLWPEGNFFSPGRGGILCFECGKKENLKISVSSGSIKLIRIFLTNKVENLVKLRISQKEENNVKIIVENYLKWISG